MFQQKTGKSSMSASVGIDNFDSSYGSVLYRVELKLLCVSKMLKNLSVLISNCNFHNTFSFVVL